MKGSPNKPEHEHVGPKKSRTTRDIITGYWGIWLILALLLVFSVGNIAGLARHDGEGIEVAEASLPPVFGKASYIGAERCKDCHWNKHDTWKNTLHSKFMQPIGEYNVLGDFEINNTLTVRATANLPKLAGKKITSRMFKKDGKYFVNTIGPDRNAHDYEITNVIGIGRRQNFPY